MKIIPFNREVMYDVLEKGDDPPYLKHPLYLKHTHLSKAELYEIVDEFQFRAEAVDAGVKETLVKMALDDPDREFIRAGYDGMDSWKDKLAMLRKLIADLPDEEIRKMIHELPIRKKSSVEPSETDKVIAAKAIAARPHILNFIKFVIGKIRNTNPG